MSSDKREEKLNFEEENWNLYASLSAKSQDHESDHNVKRLSAISI